MIQPTGSGGGCGVSLRECYAPTQRPNGFTGGCRAKDVERPGSSVDSVILRLGGILLGDEIFK